MLTGVSSISPQEPSPYSSNLDLSSIDADVELKLGVHGVAGDDSSVEFHALHLVKLPQVLDPGLSDVREHLIVPSQGFLDNFSEVNFHGCSQWNQFS